MPYENSTAPMLNDNSLQNNYLGTNASKTQSCKIFRPKIIKNAKKYINNSTNLNDVNINGACAGRGKPRYISTVGNYASMPYDWGGFSSVAQFNSDMVSGYQAGDIDTKNPAIKPVGVESCSKGIDCSGFISRAWGLPAKQGTATLTTIAYQVGNIGSIDSLRIGDILNKNAKHVMLFNGKNTDGSAKIYEATTDQQLDRVTFHQRTLSYIKTAAYTPLRYNNVCDYTDGQIGCYGKSAALFFDNMPLNFAGGTFSKKANGYNYNGTALYFNVDGSYDRSTKIISIDLAVYDDPERTQHRRTDHCEGTWDDSDSSNVFQAACQLVQDTHAGCPVIWLNMKIDEMGTIPNPASPSQSQTKSSIKKINATDTL